MMVEFFTGIVLYQLMLVAIIAVFSFVFMEKKTEKGKGSLYRVGIIAICYSAFFAARILPGIFNWQIFTMPWLSRLFSITSIIACYFLFRKQFATSDYFNVKPEKGSVQTVIAVSVLTFIGYLAVYYVRSYPTVFSVEEFLFLSILGTEEETLFRGLLLGLMMCYLNRKIGFIKYPSALLSGIIFGLYHGSFYNFDYVHIITNCVFGYIVGWITIKNKSILVPTIVHTLIILCGYLVSVVKT